MIGMNDVKRVLTQTGDRTLTLYVNVDNARRENQAEYPAWRIELKNTLDDLERDLLQEEREAWTYIRDWVDNFVKSYEPSSKTLVIIASPSYQDTFELPMAVNDEIQVFFGTAQVGPLMWLIDEFEPYLVVMADQEKAKFFTAYLGTMGFQGGMESDVKEYDFTEQSSNTRHAPSSGISGGTEMGSVYGGTGASNFERTLNEHQKRFYRDIVGEIENRLKTSDTERIILAGSEQTAHQLYNLMDERLQQQVVTIKGVPMYTNTAEILSYAKEAALEFERKQEFELVDQVINFAKSGGRGALGTDAVAEALDMQRVELLVMTYPFEDEAMFNELAYRALQLNSNIELVHGNAGALLHDEAGGVGARLYYAM